MTEIRIATANRIIYEAKEYDFYIIAFSHGIKAVFDGLGKKRPAIGSEYKLIGEFQNRPPHGKDFVVKEFVKFSKPSPTERLDMQTAVKAKRML